MSPPRPLFGILLFSCLLLLGLALSFLTPLRDHITMESMQALAERLGWWGPFALIAIGAVTPLLFLPRWPVCVLAGILYGVASGTILALIASVLGAWIHFCSSRWMVADAAASLAERLRGPLRGIHPDHLTPNRGFWIILLLRMFPFSNSSTTNLLAGAMRLAPASYLLATALGMIPSTLLYVAGGKILKKPAPSFYAFTALMLLVLIVGTWLVKRRLQPTRK